MASALDIIEFTRPHTKDKNLYVTRISNKLTRATVIAKLHQIFSQFGLLYEVQVLGSDSQPLTSEGHDLTEQSNVTSVPGSTRPGLYSFIKYYSSQAAHRALQEVNGKYMLAGQLLRVRFATRQKPIENNTQLGFQQCYELANYYLGFNGWMSQIMTLKEDKDFSEPDNARFIAMVRLDIRQHAMHSEGIGVGEVAFTPQDPMSKITAFHRAKKIAFQRASEGAFSKLILVVLPNGKVAVEVNCTAVDALHYVTQEEMNGVVQVTEIDPTNQSHNAEDDIEGALEADDTADLDDINAQLLLDLQTDV